MLQNTLFILCVIYDNVCVVGAPFLTQELRSSKLLVTARYVGREVQLMLTLFSFMFSLVSGLGLIYELETEC